MKENTLDYIEKDSVFISSTGRTGTQFFGRFLSEEIEDSFSVHEPVALWLSRPYEWHKKRKNFGWFRMTIGQFLPSTSMFKLSADRATGRIKDEKARRYAFNQRKDYVGNIRQSLYIESNTHLFGVLDLIDDIFPDSNFIFVIRDPRTWVRSALNAPEYVLYSFLDFRFFQASVRAIDFPEDPYYHNWKKLSKFERYCWYYNFLNTYVMNKMKKKKNFKIIKFEDLFYSKHRKDYFEEMLYFATGVNHSKKYNYKFDEKKLEKKVHSRSKMGLLKHWKSWDKEKARIIQKHCKRWFEEYNYGKEVEWLSNLRWVQ
jgi:hypothetical protein